MDLSKEALREDQRLREESQIAHALREIEDLRRQSKEMMARQRWLEEQLKVADARIAQLNAVNELRRQEESQAEQIERIEEQRQRKQLTDLQQRIDEAFKPVREIRAQVQEIIEQRRQEREQVNHDERQFEELHRSIAAIASQLNLLDEQQRQSRTVLGQLREGIEQRQRETTHLLELQRVEEQRLRRVTAEIQQMIEGVRGEGQTHYGRIQRLEEIRKQDRSEIERIPPRFEEIHEIIERQATDLKRLEKIDSDRHTTEWERYESLHKDMEAELAGLRQLMEQRDDRLAAVIDQSLERCNTLEVDLALIPPQLEELRRLNEERGLEIQDLEEWRLRRAIRQLEEQLEEVRQRRPRPEGDDKVRKKPS